MDERVKEFIESHPSPRPYQYDLLGVDSFRLLKIVPGADQDELELRLETHDLSTWYPQYEALSYTWGERTEVKYVSCDRLDLAITASLEIALRRFRLPMTPRYVWVDQCCINQSKIDERSQQVNRMRDIYSSASRVLAWLGRDSDAGLAENAAQAVSKLSSIIRADHSSASEDESKLQHGPKDSPPGKYTSLNPAPVDTILSSYGLPTSSSKEWHSFLSLCTRTYFERLWIIQEIRLAQTALLVWDRVEIDYHSFKDILHFLLRHDLLRQDRHRVELFMPTMRYVLPFVIGNSYQGLFGHMWWARLHKCKDPRDRVFGILALWSRLRFSQDRPAVSAAEDSDLLVADYSLSLNEALCMAAKAICKDDLRFKFLSHIHHQRLPPSTGLPSWVPDWSNSNSFLFENSSPNATKNFAPLKIDFEDENKVVTHGIIFDEVSKFSQQLSYPTSGETERFTALAPGSKRVEAFWDQLRIHRKSAPKPSLFEGEPTGDIFDDLTALIRCLKRDWHFEKDLPPNHGAGTWVLEFLRLAKWQMAVLMDGLAIDEDWVRSEAFSKWLYFPGAAVQAAGFARDTVTALNAAPLPMTIYEVTQTDVEKFVRIVKNVSDDPDEMMSLIHNLCDTWRTVNSFEGLSGSDFHCKASQGGMEGRLFFTKAGRIGVGPKVLDSGDKICVLFGGPVPYIIRPTEKKDEYLFAGECFLPGLMNGAMADHYMKPDRSIDSVKVVLC